MRLQVLREEVQSGVERLVNAAKENDVKRIVEEITSGVDVNSRWCCARRLFITLLRRTMVYRSRCCSQQELTSKLGVIELDTPHIRCL